MSTQMLKPESSESLYDTIKTWLQRPHYNQHSQWWEWYGTPSGDSCMCTRANTLFRKFNKRSTVVKSNFKNYCICLHRVAVCQDSLDVV